MTLTVHVCVSHEHIGRHTHATHCQKSWTVDRQTWRHNATIHVHDKTKHVKGEPAAVVGRLQANSQCHLNILNGIAFESSVTITQISIRKPTKRGIVSFENPFFVKLHMTCRVWSTCGFWDHFYVPLHYLVIYMYSLTNVLIDLTLQLTWYSNGT